MIDQDKIIISTIIGGLLLLFFVPPSWIAYRNTKFRLPLRILFSLTVVPLFFVLMAINYFFVADHFPALVDTWQSVTAGGNKSGKSASILAFFLTCPLSVAGCYCWYKFLNFINQKIYPEDTSQSNFSLTSSSDPKVSAELNKTAEVYIIRKHITGIRPILVKVNGSENVELYKKQYIQSELHDGKNTIALSMFFGWIFPSYKQREYTFFFNGGKRYFFLIKPSIPYATFEEISEAHAMRLVTNMRCVLQL